MLEHSNTLHPLIIQQLNTEGRDATPIIPAVWRQCM